MIESHDMKMDRLVRRGSMALTALVLIAIGFAVVMVITGCVVATILMVRLLG